jgi:hypothetical protein
MGALNRTFMTNINNLIKIKVPVQAQFKDCQTFATNLDKAEELNNELIELKNKALALKKEVEAKQTALKNFVTAAKSKIAEYDKNRESLLKVMTKDQNKDGVIACNGWAWRWARSRGTPRTRSA